MRRERSTPPAPRRGAWKDRRYVLGGVPKKSNRVVGLGVPLKGSGFKGSFKGFRVPLKGVGFRV